VPYDKPVTGKSPTKPCARSGLKFPHQLGNPEHCGALGVSRMMSCWRSGRRAGRGTHDGRDGIIAAGITRYTRTVCAEEK